MSRHPRIRRISKWTGLVFCVLIVVARAVSLRPWMWCSGDTWAYDCSAGSIGIAFSESLGDPGWTKIAAPVGNYWGFHWIDYRWHPCGGNPASAVRVPLWLPLVVIAIPTTILFYRDRRRIPPGHCQKCGYNLTGNESGICPECGRTI